MFAILLAYTYTHTNTKYKHQTLKDTLQPLTHIKMRSITGRLSNNYYTLRVVQDMKPTTTKATAITVRMWMRYCTLRKKLDKVMEIKGLKKI